MMTTGTPDASSSVHGLATNPQTLVYAFSRSQRRLLGFRLPLQERVIAAVQSTGIEGCGRRASRINCCSQCVGVGSSASGLPAVQIFRCRDRLCQICTRYRSIAAEDRILTLLKSMASPKFLTLTLADDGQPLQQRLDRIVAAFRDLRRRQVWLSNVRGCVAAIEMTRGAEDRHWHVHLHVLIDAEYVPQAVLSSEWQAVTGDSYIVDIRAVPDGRRAAKYLAKYAAKGCDISKLDQRRLVEFVAAMHRRRTLITAGECHGRAKDVDDWEPRNRVVTETISVSQIRSASARGCHAAASMLDMMSQAGGLVALIADTGAGAERALTEAEWLKYFRKSWVSAMKQTRAWLDRHGPAGLPRPPRDTGAQLRFGRPGESGPTGRASPEAGSAGPRLPRPPASPG